MIIERLTDLAGLESLETEWRALEERLPRLPFFTYDWAHTWWTRLRADSPGVRDELYIRVFRAANGELCGIVPLMRTRRPGVGPLYVRHLQFFGADPNITELRTIIAPAEHLPAVLSALLDHLRESSGDWDFIQLAGVPVEHAERVLLSGLGDVRWVHDIPNYHLVLAPTWEEFKTGLSRNIKESLRKCYNAPKRDGVTLELKVVRERSEARAAVGEFLRLHLIRSEREDMVRHTNVFENEAGREFLIDVCERFAARDRLRIFQLKIGDVVIATRIGFCCQDSLYLYYSGYDPEYARYSVMTTTVAEAIQFAIREGFRTVNLSTGKDVSKLRWGPEERIFREALLISPSMRAAAAYKSYIWLARQLLRPKLRKLLTTSLARGA